MATPAGLAKLGLLLLVEAARVETTPPLAGAVEPLASGTRPLARFSQATPE